MFEASAVTACTFAAMRAPSIREKLRFVEFDWFVRFKCEDMRLNRTEVTHFIRAVAKEAKGLLIPGSDGGTGQSGASGREFATLATVSRGSGADFKRRRGVGTRLTADRTRRWAGILEKWAPVE